MQDRWEKNQELLDELKQNEARLKAINDASPFGIFLTDPEGSCIYTNKRYQELTGLTFEETLGRGWERGLYQYDKDLVSQLWLEALNKDEFFFESEYRYRYTQKEYKWVKVKSVTIKHEDQLLGYLGTVEDITETKYSQMFLKIQKRIYESQSHKIGTVLTLRTLVELVEEYDHLFHCSFLLNTKEGEKWDVLLSGKYPHHVYNQIAQFDFSDVQGIFKQALETQKPIFKESISDDPFIKKNAEVFINMGLQSCWALPVFNEQMNVGGIFLIMTKFPLTPERNQIQLIEYIQQVSGQVIEFYEEITRKEQDQAKLVSTNKMASLGEMAGGIAHEVNNPLTIIYGKSMQIKKMIEKDQVDLQKTAESVDKIMKTADRIAKIIRGLKVFAREGDQDPFEEKLFSEIIEETIGFCEARFHNNSVKLEVENSSPDAVCECRSVQISQVLINLLNNAFDAICENPNSWIKLKVRDESEYLRIEVVDSGSGIPPHVADKILQPFFTTKEVGKGTGLGLSISVGIIKDHHGKLFVDKSNPNTCFVILLPKEQSSEQVA